MCKKLGYFLFIMVYLIYWSWLIQKCYDMYLTGNDSAKKLTKLGSSVYFWVISSMSENVFMQIYYLFTILSFIGRETDV